MPQVQVLNRTVDPTAQLISDAGSSVADAIYKHQHLKLEQLRLKNEMAQTQSEAEKAKIAQQIADIKLFADVQPILQNLPEDQKMPALTKLMGGDQHRVMKFLDAGGKVFASAQSPQDQKAGTENQILQKALQNFPQGGNQSQSAQPSTPDGGGMQLSGMNVGGLTFTDPSFAAKLDRMKTLAEEGAKKELKAQDLKTSLEDYLKYEGQIPRHHGGVGDAVKQAAALRYQSLAQQDNGLANAFYSKGADLAKYIARRVDVGNLSAYEQKVAKNLVPTDTDSQEARDIKVKYLQLLTSQVDGLGDGDSAAAKRLIDNAVLQLNAETGKDRNPRANALRSLNIQSTQPKTAGRFTIEEVQ